ncbi:MAG: hypothetical protein AAGI53_17775 [Planctomycetota bacterium]
MAENTSPARVSIRTLLISILVAGAVFGLLGRWFLRSPDLFMGSVVLLTTAAPFLLTAGVLIRIGAKEGRRRLLWLGWLAIAAPFVGAGVLAVTAPLLAVDDFDYSTKPTSELISVSLVQDIEDYWAWAELESRLKSGKLSAEQANDALTVFAEHLEGLTPNQLADYYWSAQGEFAESSAAAGMIDEDLLVRLCDAFFDRTAEVTLRGRPSPSDKDIELEVFIYSDGSSYGTSLGHQLLWWPVAATVVVDEQVVEADLSGGVPGPEADEDGYEDNSTWRGRLALAEPLAAGEHTVALQIAYAYLDEAKLLGLGHGAVPDYRWPTALKRWTQTTGAQIEIRQTSEAAVALSDNPAHDPMKTKAVLLGRLVLQAEEEGTSRLALELDEFDSEVVPLAFTLHATVNGQELAMGNRVATGGCGCDGDDRESGTVVLPTPAAGVVTADLEFRPDPELVKPSADVDRIWGKPLVFRSVPIERLDLEARAPTSEVAAGPLVDSSIEQ